jgi:hypothetical protein
MSGPRRPFALGAILAVAAMPATAEPPGVDQLIGTFVGRAADDPALDRTPEQRDIVMEIAPYQDAGLRLDWHNVTLVDGRRDVPGVKYRHDEVLLVPAPDRAFFLAAVGYDPFAEKKKPNAIAGDPLRWGAVSGEALDLIAFTILEDGTYELQVSRRHPSGDGVRLDFQRVVDGTLVRHMVGHAVRAE